MTIERRLRVLTGGADAMQTDTVVRVAFATSDMRQVNQHFGAAVGFVIYALDEERAQLVELAEFPPESMDGNESKLPAKIAALTGCSAVYCLAPADPIAPDTDRPGGRTPGPADPAILISRDGRTFPVSDSVAPSFEKRIAVAAPMPELAPVGLKETRP